MNSLGRFLTVTLYGESHGTCVGVVIDGFPAGFPVNWEAVQHQLALRRPGQSSVTTPRRELDQLQVRGGWFEDRTTGAPLVVEVLNRDPNSRPYYEIRHTPRPSHADYTANVRYGGNNDFRGGGRFSGRMTVGLVLAGAVARQVLETEGIMVRAYTKSVGGVCDSRLYTVSQVDRARESNPVRAVDADLATRMVEEIEAAKRAGDSVGGVVHCRVEGVEPGVGDPFFDTLEGVLAKALFSIPAIRGVEFGDGFAAAKMRGSQHNDPLSYRGGKVVFKSNHCGGVLGGISTGTPIELNVAFKPTPSISVEQETVDLSQGRDVKVKVLGRHDPCIVPRAVPVVENTVAFVLLDALMVAGRFGPVFVGKKKRGERKRGRSAGVDHESL